MPVVTEPRKAAGALGASVAEMERRYKLFAENNVRDIKSYNKLAKQHPDVLEHLPYIAIIIDELADLMMVAGKEVARLYTAALAQKSPCGRYPPDCGNPAPQRGRYHRPDLKPTSPAVLHLQFPARSTPAPFWTAAAPKGCWATAICCSCRSVLPSPCVCRVPL